MTRHVIVDLFDNLDLFDQIQSLLATEDSRDAIIDLVESLR